jgi:hypothetical protein
LIDVEVDDLGRLVEKLGATPIDSRVARVKDPVGNDIWITQTKQ